MQNWVFVLNKADLPALGRLRCWPGMQVAESDAEIWLICPWKPDGLNLELRQIPAIRTYQGNASGLLFGIGKKTPEARLPQLNWIPLDQFLPIELPTAALPAYAPDAIPLRLVPSGQTQAGIALKTSFEIWQQYAETAPAIRLEVLQFALSEKAEVIIVGTPLPPIPGEELWLQDSILLPSGYGFEWPILAHILQMRENEKEHCLMVFDKEGNWQKIEKQHFVPASRAGIRLSKEA